MLLLSSSPPAVSLFFRACPVLMMEMCIFAEEEEDTVEGVQECSNAQKCLASSQVFCVPLRSLTSKQNLYVEL